MKKHLINSLIFSAFFGTILFITFPKTSYAPRDLNLPLLTYCCVGGTYTGYSNDCVEGQGGCQNGSCAPGETEKPTSNC